MSNLPFSLNSKSSTAYQTRQKRQQNFHSGCLKHEFLSQTGKAANEGSLCRDYPSVIGPGELLISGRRRGAPWRYLGDHSVHLWREYRVAHYGILPSTIIFFFFWQCEKRDNEILVIANKKEKQWSIHPVSGHVKLRSYLPTRSPGSCDQHRAGYIKYIHTRRGRGD